jgi:hypothetical protein
MSLSASDITAILKELYPDNRVRELLYKTSPFLGMVPKDREAYGELVKVPLRYGTPQTASATFAQRASGIAVSKYAAFDVTTVNDYAFAAVSGEAIDKAKNDKGSFVRSLDREIQGAMTTAKRRISHNIFRSGTGSIGRRASASTNIITLTNASDTRFFEVGMTVQATDTDGGTLRTGSTTVTAVDRSGGTVTLASAAAISSFADNDFLLPAGDLNAKLKGLEAWIPASAPGATAFFGVDRSVDTVRLGGNRADYSGRNIEEALIDAMELVSREGGSPDCIVVHTSDFANLQKAMAGKVVYGARDSYDTKVGYRSIELMGPTGKVDVVADPDAVPNVCWVLQLDTWTLYSMGETPKYLDNDGNAILRTTTSDAVELQLVSRLNLACSAPGWNGRFVIGS